MRYFKWRAPSLLFPRPLSIHHAYKVSVARDLRVLTPICCLQMLLSVSIVLHCGEKWVKVSF